MTSEAFENMFSLQEENTNSAEYKIITKIREVELSYRLFLRNYRELKRLLDIIENPSVAIKLWDKNKLSESIKVLNEVTCLLHNYVASVFSLVDHTRHLRTKLYDKDYPSRFEEIQAEIDRRFTNDGTHQIIQGIRDYTLHRKLPPVMATMSSTATDNKLEPKYVISAKSLLEWDGWKSLAKNILEKAKDADIIQIFSEHQKNKNVDIIQLISRHQKNANIHINQLISDHHKNVVSFYRWLGQKQKGWHKEDEQKLADKTERLKQLQTGQGPGGRPEGD